MLSRAIPHHANRREHLVIELKAPKVPLTEDHTNQIEKYAQAVANDPQFRDTNTEWTFILVGNDYNDVVRRKITQRGRAKGILIEPGDQENVKYTVWVKTWSQILEDCRWRMKFFHDRFEYVPEEDDASTCARHMTSSCRKFSHGRRPPMISRTS
jgi:hypothetical protein